MILYQLLRGTEGCGLCEACGGSRYPKGLLIPSATGLPCHGQLTSLLIRRQEQAGRMQTGLIPIRQPDARPRNEQLADQIAQMQEDLVPDGASAPDGCSLTGRSPREETR